MSTTDPIDYRAVLADLEAKKAVLERMIEGAKQMLGMSIGAPTPATSPENGAKEPTKISYSEITFDSSDKPFLGMSVPEAVRKLLRVVKEKQSTTQIVEALQRGGMQSISKDFWRTVYTTLQRVWENQGDIVQVDGTNWALAEWFPGRKFEKPPKQKGKAGRKPKDAKKVIVKTKTATPKWKAPDYAEDGSNDSAS